MCWPGTSASGTNNIFYDNSAYVDNNINGSAAFTYTCVNTTIPGSGNITSNPQFVNQSGGDYNLTSGSPCIDTGNPNSPLDPDGTRADMGALYFDQAPGSPLTVTLTPFGMPIVVPVGGGTINFNIAIGNSGASAEQVDVWTMVTLPSGSQYGPIINFPNLTVNPGWSGNRDRNQAIPGSAPAGNYVYDAYIGDYPNDPVAEDHFNFSKSAAADGGSIVVGWNSYGESFDDLAGDNCSAAPESYNVLSAYPNPFNPTTKLNFEIQEADFVSLTVYDVNGRSCGILLAGYVPAGEHEVIFDAEGLSSGLYFSVLKSGNISLTEKLLLIK